MEQFDLVDINDNIIGTTDKETSHQNGEIHRVIAIYVFNSQNELYVQEHLKSGGLWDNSVGGHVIKNETYDQAAQREGFEELNLNCPLQKISTFYSDETFGKMNIKHMFGLYECTPVNWQFIPNEEVKNIIPLKIEDVIQLMSDSPNKFTPGFLNTMSQYISQKQLPFKIKEYRSRWLNP